MRETIATVCIGAVLVSVGVALIYLPAGIITAGLFTIGAGVLLTPVSGDRT